MGDYIGAIKGDTRTRSLDYSSLALQQHLSFQMGDWGLRAWRFSQTGGALGDLRDT